MLGLFYSDIHYRETGSFPPFNKIEENGLTRELNNINLGMKFVADQIRKHKPRIVGCLGDIYHTPEALPTSVIHASAIGLEMIRSACFEVGAVHYIMPGNHDMLSDKHKIFSTSVLTGYCQGLITETQEIEIGDKTVAFVMFDSDKEKVQKDLEHFDGKVDLICTHLDFKGARYETGKTSPSQISPNLKTTVISGDIHLYQKLGNVWYIGSLVQNRFNRYDTNGIGGVLIYDFEKDKVTRIKNTESLHYVKIDSIDELEGLSPETCILQVKTRELSDQDKELLQDYLYIHTPMPAEREQLETGGKVLSLDRPQDILRAHIQEVSPNLLETFDEVLTGEQNAN